ncbi:hypothetical protein VCRA2119O147_60084 [Vibrio crassostreae]|uniref:hypothetical protein n=1 Tax=Vibrio crassostreae TaxID=246167 RepID=UPI0005DDC70A|nr:hypothetical protein [Vibrio crassostreae]CAK1712812.1 hypothetical protein VCRA2112O187_100016 [Vibrio crassostreae]CAK1751913.1 hypothetical protein VCRA2116O233_140022 [Vibrio crassostreae]CAK1752966.1 hypothetical protein VCRA2113O193_130085 [Vibrio crassostreae]CAK1762056.1 hypothetical protein VCRA2112E186_140084 [Vibrio crassostreae]CAK1773104.1 hypothetical protein VCRA2112O185_140087 [Vibrio crassostreae]
MDSLEYKYAKTLLGISNPDIWCPYFSITRDQDKSYSSGRTKIPDRVAQWIGDELVDQKYRVGKLKSDLEKCFPDTNIEVSEENCDIKVFFDEGTCIEFENEGKDHQCIDVYSFNINSRVEHRLLFFPHKHWSGNEKERKEKIWGLWNYSGRNQPLGRALVSKLTKDLFNELGLEA